MTTPTDRAPSSPAAANNPITALLFGRLAPFLLALGLIGPFCFRLIPESDLGWHLALGREVARSGIPFRNALCWTALDSPWYATSWLFDWVGYLLVTNFGLIAIQLLMLALVGITLAGALVAGARLDSRHGGWVAPILAVLLIPRVAERPFVATWAVLAWVLALCLPKAGQGEPGESTFRRRLWCLPLIALGSNLHQGALFGSILLFAFCAEAFVLGARRPREVVLGLAGFLADLGNPGGLFSLRDTLEHVHVTSVVPINEYQTPTWRVDYTFYLLAIIAVALAWQARRKVPALFVLTVLFAAFGAWAIRFMYDFDVIATPVLAFGFPALARRRMRPGFPIAALIALVIAANWHWTDSLRLMGPAWNRWAVPVGAADFVRNEKLDGRMYNGYWEGGYLEWAVPELHWFQDARPHAFPSDFFRDAYAVDGSPGNFQQWLSRWRVDWAITGTEETLGLEGRHLLHSPEWALVYWDETSEVFLRRDVQRFAPLIRRLEYRHFQDSAPLLKDLAAASRAELPEWTAELDRFQRAAPDHPQGWLARCAIAARQGQPGAACDAALPMDKSPEWRATVEAARTIMAAP